MHWADFAMLVLDEELKEPGDMLMNVVEITHSIQINTKMFHDNITLKH